ncbi:unnamed protein product [Paramecium pentaurelia]|uniref:Uncharacterized protein n=1 Tax=Paramecium pentaurelia TaxID=43138 RepID=A0A8S1YMP0_9CILI|nr:unnamed protein product [Paramecium pentaurelia]
MKSVQYILCNNKRLYHNNQSISVYKICRIHLWIAFIVNPKARQIEMIEDRTTCLISIFELLLELSCPINFKIIDIHISQF